MYAKMVSNNKQIHYHSENMESLREVPAPDNKSGNVLCKVGKGWTCIITRTEGPDAGKVFLKCGENCTCTLDGEAVTQQELPPDVVSSSGDSDSQAFCNCGEGWSCSIFKTEGPNAGSGKGFAECAEQSKCSCSV